MDERVFMEKVMEKGCSRRGFLGAGGVAALFVGLGAAVAWADDKKPDGKDSDELWSAARTDTMQTVTDMDGDRVDVVQIPGRIADTWADHTAAVCALNMGVGLVATAATREGHPWLYQIVPTVGEAQVAPTGGFSAKDLEALKPDVVFADDDDLRDGLKGTNVPVIDVECDTLDELRQSLRLTGQVLGGEAVDRAEAVIEQLDGQAGRVAETLRGSSEKDRPSVLYGTSVYTGVADGAEAFSAGWIEAAGGRVANADDEDEDETYNVNDLIALNPDVIVTETPAEVEQILNDAAWASVAAVQNQQVYVNPRGLNSWAAPGPEVSLQVAWLASKLYPDWASAEEVETSAQDFYRQFCDYDLSDDEFQLMLAAQPPVAVSENGLTEAEIAYAQDEVAKEQADSGNIPRKGPIDENLPGMEAQDTVME